MLFRRISKHVENQNWFAVLIDFAIVVIGVFIGIQVANWNEARADRAQEAAILSQLKDEFTEISVALEKQITIREGYTDNLMRLVTGLEGSGLMPDDFAIKSALIAARSTGRRPAASAAYLQLTVNGDLARLSNENLKQALIRYHARLERDAFIFPELMRTVILEMSTNAFVDYDISGTGTAGAAIDSSIQVEVERANAVRSYDFEAMREYEERYEALYLMHSTLVDTDKTQLELAADILTEISKETK
jgi:hypothetical protein